MDDTIFSSGFAMEEMTIYQIVSKKCCLHCFIGGYQNAMREEAYMVRGERTTATDKLQGQADVHATRYVLIFMLSFDPSSSVTTQLLAEGKN